MTDSNQISRDRNKQEYSFANEVAQRGDAVYRLLGEKCYSGSKACVNLYNGDGALAPHAVVRAGILEIANNIEIWGDSKDKTIELQRYRPPKIMIIPALKEAIINDFVKSMPPSVKRDDLMVNIGAGTTNLVSALFNNFRQQNQPILMFAPTYTSFLYTAITMSNQIILVPPQSDGMVTPEMVEDSINTYRHAKVLMLISPNNPTGQYYNRQELEKIARLAFERDLIIISDETFHKLVFDDKNPFVSLASIEIDGKSMLERTITLRSVSKDHGLAAVRSGFAIGHKVLMRQVGIGNYTFGTIFTVDELAQLVTAVALSRTPPEYIRAQQDLLRRHRDIYISSIQDLNRRAKYQAFTYTPTFAGMFLIIDGSGLRGKTYKGKILDSDMILFYFLLEENVAFLPASCGGCDASEMKLRVTLASPEEDIRTGMERLTNFVLKLDRSML